MTEYTDPVTGFRVRTNQPDPTPKPAPPLTERKRLEEHLLKKYGEITPLQKQALDIDFPEPVIAPFGSVGQGITGPRSSGDPLDIKDHQDFLNRKAEIMAAAFPDDHRN